MPNQEQFDAMNDSAFTDWWDVWMERQQQNATSEEEVQAAQDQMNVAFNSRFGD